MENWSVLGRLKRAVKKVRFLINFSVNRLRLASQLIGGRGGESSGRRRPLSFNDRPGLIYYSAADESHSESEQEPGSGRSMGGGGIQRTFSYRSEEDVDGRAEAFIANFYRQLRMERQVSLELRYCRGNSFDSSTSP